MVRGQLIKKDEGYKLKHENHIKKNTIDQEKSQLRLFQNAMKILLVFGQCIGLNPVTNITETDSSKIK